MKNSTLLITLILLIATHTAHGKWNDRQGNPIEDTEWMKSSGDFGAQLLLIGNEKEFFKRWNTPSEKVNFETVTEINQGEPLITPIIFSGCYINNSGNCMVSAALTILRPDGTTYADMPQVEVWENKPPPPKGILELSVGYLKITIEPEDPVGTYTVQAIVTDKVKKSSFVLTRTFSFPSHKKLRPGKQPDEETIKEINQWFTYYYKTPRTAQDIENIKKIFQSGFFSKPSAVAPLVMFLAEFFRQNEDMIPSWSKSLHEIPQDENFFLLHSLWQANTDNTLTVLNNWPDLKSKKIIEKIKERPPVNLKTTEVYSPAILDMLWATFMASGNALYVERIIDALSLPTDSENQDKRISNLLIVGAAKWSLSSNATQHELVFEICQKFAESKNPIVREAISEILEKAKESNAKKKR